MNAREALKKHIDGCPFACDGIENIYDPATIEDKIFRDAASAREAGVDRDVVMEWVSVAEALVVALRRELANE